MATHGAPENQGDEELRFVPELSIVRKLKKLFKLFFVKFYGH